MSSATSTPAHALLGMSTLHPLARHASIPPSSPPPPLHIYKDWHLWFCLTFSTSFSPVPSPHSKLVPSTSPQPRLWNSHFLPPVFSPCCQSPFSPSSTSCVEQRPAVPSAIWLASFWQPPVIARTFPLFLLSPSFFLFLFLSAVAAMHHHHQILLPLTLCLFPDFLSQLLLNITSFSHHHTFSFLTSLRQFSFPSFFIHYHTIQRASSPKNRIFSSVEPKNVNAICSTDTRQEINSAPDHI